MTNIFQQTQKLKQYINKHTQNTGTYPTSIPALYFSRVNQLEGPRFGVHTPSLCIVIQGKKVIMLGKETYEYTASDYLITSVQLPIAGQAYEVTNEKPYFALKIEFTPKEILELLPVVEIKLKKELSRGMRVSKLNSPIADAVLRLVSLIDNPDDISFLAPIYKKEILYKLLKSEHGEMLRQIAIEGSQTNKVTNVIQRIIRDYNQHIKIEELADMAHMSISSFHRHFKEVTAMSPIQFQKQIRLQEARKLLLTNTIVAAQVAYEVGYESPSQFSREYSRMFGHPPRKDIERIRKMTDENSIK